MNIILLSGGSGKRLWPLSNEIRSKQFLRLLKNQEGRMESMVQRVYGQIKKAGLDANVIIATGESQVDAIRSQLGNDVTIVTEPERRNTFPAIALSCAYLAFEQHISREEPVIVMPVDPYADMEYFRCFPVMEMAVRQSESQLILMGIEPAYPSSKYGYMIPEQYESTVQEHSVTTVKSFVEKPDEQEARLLIDQGAFWNGGVFAFRIGYVLDIAKHFIDAPGYGPMRQHYGCLKKNSFDYEVVEKAKSVGMVIYRGMWKDLGTWNTLTEEMEEPCIGNVIVGENIQNTSVINELSIPVVALGTKNLIIAASPDGILVSDKEKSSYMKPYVEELGSRPMYGEHSWGDYKVLDYIQYPDGAKSLTRHLTILNNQIISEHYHQLRKEIWTILDGSGTVYVNDERMPVKKGDVITILPKQRHRLNAESDMHLIEIQLGSELTDEDTQEGTVH